MTFTQLLQIKDKLILDLSSMQQEISDLQEKTKPITPDCSLGRLTI